MKKNSLLPGVAFLYPLVSEPNGDLVDQPQVCKELHRAWALYVIFKSRNQLSRQIHNEQRLCEECRQAIPPQWLNV